MEPNQTPQLTDQRETWRVLDALPLFFAACVVALMLIAMLLTLLSDIYATIVTKL